MIARRVVLISLVTPVAMTTWESVGIALVDDINGPLNPPASDVTT